MVKISTTILFFIVITFNHKIFADSVLFVGDSVMAGLPKKYLRDKLNNQFIVEYETKECRKLTSIGCFHNSPESALTILSKKSADTIVIMLGHNDNRNKSFRSKVKILLNKMSNTKHVYWLTMREVSKSYQNANVILKEEIATYKNTQLIDWAEFSRNEPTWFVRDGTHLKPIGARNMADFIVRILLL
jgi:hypothetical protein